ncbi:MAG: DUF2334 domain-containing protein [Thaumarchaeota archaeon]|nr:DUF2334 domain-containing protein [Nitrososphaerota archaeon]
MKYTILLALSFVLFFTIPHAFAETGTIELFLKNENGDRISPVDITLKVYKNLDTNPIKVIDQLDGNPFQITSLPLDQRYKVEVYVNSMYADSGFVDLQKPSQKLDMTVENMGGMRLTILYNDAQTPIGNVHVNIRSQDDHLWKSTQTDSLGQTERTWLYPPQKSDNYYYIEVIIGPNLKYVYQPIKLLPGISQEFKIPTKWPKIIDNQITVELYNSTKNKITKQDGRFVAQVYDIKKNKVADFEISNKGLGSFTNLKVGNYALYIKSIDSAGNLNTVAGKKITVTDDLSLVKVYLHNPELNNDYLNCNCVAFRLDDVQDYFLAPAQAEILSVFDQTKTPLTIGIIGSVIGSDQSVVNPIKAAIASGDEIANHSWRHGTYTKMTKADQESDLIQTNKKIMDIFGVTPTTFIPPQNLYDDDTISVLKSNKFTHLSPGEDGSTDEPAKFQKSSFYQFPAFAYTAKLNPATGFWRPLSAEQTLSQIDDSLFNYGYAVVMIHPYEFSVYENGGYVNKVNSTKIVELKTLIEKVRAQNYSLTTVNQIQNFDQPKTIPKPKPAEPTPSSCNCLAFRIDNIQDYWLNDVQNTILDTFAQTKTPVTITVIGKFIGDDPKATNHIKEIANKSQIAIANRGWEYIDHTSFDKEKQKASITQTNDKIKKIFGKTPTLFSPPYDAFNKDTISAVKESGLTYFSASVSSDSKPFPTDSLKHVPSTMSFSNLINDDPFYSGTIPQKAQAKIQASLKQNGYAIISLQPSDIAVKTDSYKNEIDSQKLELLKSVILGAKSAQIKLVSIDSISDRYTIPDWIKNNAKWWADGKITDSDFTKGIQYLIKKEIIKVPQTQKEIVSKKIPDWIKTTAKFWSEGQTTDNDFIKALQYLIQNGIISI